MIDFHTHILCNMDDGADSVYKSRDMINASFQCGVNYIVATPHYDSNVESPEHFIKRRTKSFSNICEAFPVEREKIFLGAEVKYFEGMSRCAELEALKIEGTNTILLEMPFVPWTNRMTDEAMLLSEKGYTVVLAHIERYLNFVKNNMLSDLTDCNVLIQSNAAFFTGFLSSLKAVKMLRNGNIHIIGSDCHNMETRPPDNIAAAYAVIKKKLGAARVKQIDNTAAELLCLE